MNAFRSLGRLGLSRFIYEEAQKRAMEYYSWALLVADEKKGLTCTQGSSHLLNGGYISKTALEVYIYIHYMEPLER